MVNAGIVERTQEAVVLKLWWPWHQGTVEKSIDLNSDDLGSNLASASHLTV